jgi:hypothetical protein
MVDPFGTILSWSIIVGVSAYIVYHFAMIFRHMRMEIHNAAAIMFGTGWLIIELPRRVYSLPADALDALNWLGIITVLASIAIELPGRRVRRDSAKLERPPA